MSQNLPSSARERIHLVDEMCVVGRYENRGCVGEVGEKVFERDKELRPRYWICLARIGVLVGAAVLNSDQSPGCAVLAEESLQSVVDIVCESQIGVPVSAGELEVPLELIVMFSLEF